ncbi:MAG: carboxypeptidase-like regulatory domain-containing protein [Methylophilaceae bacterium]
MATILHQIGTPLQLVALFLLLVAGIARLLLRSGKLSSSQALTRLAINRIFAAGLTALILGLLIPVVAPVLDKWLNGDETFHGVVLSATGAPISGATINLLSIAIVTTNPSGQFDITVPRSRVLSEYRIQVQAQGYKTPDILTISASKMRSFEIKLTPALPELVKTLESNLIIGQYYGLPLVLATFRVENTATSTLNINEIRGNLTGANGSFMLIPVAWTIVNSFGPFAPVTGPFPIPAGARLDLRVVMMTGANVASLMAKLNALPEYRSQMPCSQSYGKAVEPLSDDAYTIVDRFAFEHFLWREGNWNLQLSASTDNETKSFTRDFSLSVNEITRLRDSIALIRQCLSINMTAPLAQDGSLANFLSK